MQKGYHGPLKELQSKRGHRTSVVSTDKMQAGTFTIFGFHDVKNKWRP